MNKKIFIILIPPANQKAPNEIQDFLTRRATESHRIPFERNHPGISWWPTLVGDTLQSSLRNNNHIIEENENNSSNGEAVFDSLRNTDTQLIPVYL